MKFRDYYTILGIARDASQEDVQTAFRKLARQFHPDVNKTPGAEDKFKDISEAYEVLRDVEKRRRYDALGSDFRHNQDFNPPPEWQGGGTADFEEMFGDSFISHSDFFKDIFGGFGRGGRGRSRGEDIESVMQVTLEEAFRGGTRDIRLGLPDGAGGTKDRTIELKIPTGVTHGRSIRLAGQGVPGRNGGPAGDLYLKIEIKPHPLYSLEGRDITIEVPVTPAEAVLGASVDVPTLDGRVSLKIAPGTSSGARLRLRGKGLPNPNGAPGDMYAVVKIAVPATPEPQEKELYDKLAAVSRPVRKW
ncbi:MAG: DnaJ C-terminal domain-containing protein [Candidatus Brocadiia bacterium]